MSCYKPLLGLWYGATDYETGKRRIKILPNSAVKDYVPGQLYQGYEATIIPCGHCLGCRLDYSRQWADRMMLELDACGKGIFVTLTYDDFHMPQNKSLDKRTCQLWMKRLRKQYSDYKIRFYLAGEYGSESGRCHYHAILFGIGLEDIDDLKFYKRTKLGFSLYTSETMSKVWENKGYVIIAPVSWQCCAYVARYVTKKVNGMTKEQYKELGLLPEFSLMSRKPGIAKKYLELHPDCLDKANINISTPEGGLKIQIPKYYLKILERSDPDRYKIITEDRKKFANDKAMLELSKTDLDFQEYLDMLYEKRKNSAKALVRQEI